MTCRVQSRPAQAGGTVNAPSLRLKAPALKVCDVMTRVTRVTRVEVAPGGARINEVAHADPQAGEGQPQRQSPDVAGQSMNALAKPHGESVSRAGPAVHDDEGENLS